MNTDVIFLTMMMDILTAPIPAPFADEFSSLGGERYEAAGYNFFHSGFGLRGHIYSCLSS